MPAHNIEDVVKGALGGVGSAGSLVALWAAFVARKNAKENVKVLTDSQLNQFATNLLSNASQQIANYERLTVDQQAQIEQLIARDHEKDEQIQAMIISGRQKDEQIEKLTELSEKTLKANKRLTTSLNSERRKNKTLLSDMKRTQELERRVEQLEEDKRVLLATQHREVEVLSEGELGALETERDERERYSLVERRRKP